MKSVRAILFHGYQIVSALCHQHDVPYLAEAEAHFFCHVDNDNYCYGTHQIVIGRMYEVMVAKSVVDPLVYLDGDYRQLLVTD